MASLACLWVGTYAALGLPVSAVIPFAYQFASAASIYTFARTCRYLLFRRSQLWMSLVFPFVLQVSLGGFENSSAVCLCAFTAPLGALLFGGTQALQWFVTFAGLVLVSAGVDHALATRAPHIPSGVVVTAFVLNVLGVATRAYVLLQYFVRAREREQAKSERLLLNVLPAPVAARLKREEEIIADAYAAVTVLFADIVGFTPLTERLSASNVVALLDRLFARWDALAAEHRGREDQNDRRCLYGRWRHPTVADRPHRGDRRDGPGNGARGRAISTRDRICAGGANRHRHRPRSRWRDRAGEGQLRPLGRHRQHCQPHSVSPPTPGNPGYSANL
jgi:adenylate/guanylate cyclase family protein